MAKAVFNPLKAINQPLPGVMASGISQRKWRNQSASKKKWHGVAASGWRPRKPTITAKGNQPLMKRNGGSNIERKWQIPVAWRNQKSVTPISWRHRSKTSISARQSAALNAVKWRMASISAESQQRAAQQHQHQWQCAAA